MAEYPIFYSFRRCPYAMRARMALLISELTVELREILLRDKPADMLAISPKATVPVLQLPHGRVIDESLDIMRWALAHHDPAHWLAGDDPTLIAENDGPFKAALDRYKYPSRYDLADGLAHREQGMAILQKLDQRLQGKPWLGGAAMGLSDAATFPFIRQFAATDQGWFDAQNIPALQNWLKQCLALPLFDQAMAKFAQWQAGDAPTLFHQH